MLESLRRTNKTILQHGEGGIFSIEVFYEVEVIQNRSSFTYAYLMPSSRTSEYATLSSLKRDTQFRGLILHANNQLPLSNLALPIWTSAGGIDRLLSNA